jgi:hypothetical protein
MYTAGVQLGARVTSADIARLAGVGRAAVSNWRKLYSTFPAPVGGTAASPEFALDQVERWLIEQDKLPGVADEDRLWRNLLAAAGDPAASLAAAGDACSAAGRCHSRNCVPNSPPLPTPTAPGPLSTCCGSASPTFLVSAPSPRPTLSAD